MDLNYTLNYSFVPENITYVMPYNQDMVITLLMIIAFCEVVRLIFIIAGFIEKMYGIKTGGKK